MVLLLLTLEDILPKNAEFVTEEELDNRSCGYRSKTLPTNAFHRHV
jgi:hypothetical protein